MSDVRPFLSSVNLIYKSSSVRLSVCPSAKGLERVVYKMAGNGGNWWTEVKREAIKDFPMQVAMFRNDELEGRACIALKF